MYKVFIFKNRIKSYQNLAISRGLRVFSVKMLLASTRDLAKRSTTLLGPCYPSVYIIMIVICEFRSYLELSHGGVADETI